MWVLIWCKELHSNAQLSLPMIPRICMPPDGHLDSLIQDTPVSKNKTSLSNQLEKKIKLLQRKNIINQFNSHLSPLQGFGYKSLYGTFLWGRDKLRLSFSGSSLSFGQASLKFNFSSQGPFLAHLGYWFC